MNKGIAASEIEDTLKLAIILTFIFFIVELAGGYISGSLSLMGDAGHMLRDVFALFIALSAIKIAKKDPTMTRTFGYHRLEIFAALINGLLLIGISIWICVEAYHRIMAPRPVESTVMIGVAFVGLVVNLYVTLRLHGSHDLNVRGAYLHVLTDTFSSVAVIFASFWIFLTGETIVDSILGIVIALFILFSAFSIIRDSIYVLLDFVPRNINIHELIRDMETVEGVQEVHDVHLWSLCSNVNVLDAHVFTTESDTCRMEQIKKELKRQLEKYNVKHATLEFEWSMCNRNGKINRIEH